MPEEFSEAALLRAAIDACLEGFAAEVVRDMVDTSFWGKAGASAHLQRLIGEGLKGHLATFEGVSGAILVRRGTEAGNLVADLFFCVALMKITSKMRKRLLAVGSEPRVPLLVLAPFFRIIALLRVDA